MKKNSDELKNSVIARMMPPNNERIVDIARETSIHKLFGCLLTIKFVILRDHMIN